MTAAAPPPLVPAEVDLRDFGFMPLDVVRLRDAGISSKASGEEFRAAVLLWCAAWHQVPAGSLPDDEIELARFAGFGRVVREWRKVRDGALRSWVKCDDGRWYHPVVAEKALEAWDGKLFQRWRTESNRIRKHNERHDTAIHFPDFETWKSHGCPMGQALAVTTTDPKVSHGQTGGVARETVSKGQGEGQLRDRDRDRDIKKDTRKRPASPRVVTLTASDLQADGLTAETAEAYLAHRAKRRAPLTRIAWDGIKAEAQKAAGWTLDDVARKCIARGWTGFEAAWLHDARPANGSGHRPRNDPHDHAAEKRRRDDAARRLLGFDQEGRTDA